MAKRIKRKKAGLLAKLVFLLIVIYISYMLINLQIQINSKNSQLSDLSDKIAAKSAEKDELSEILNAEVDREYVEKVARSLGYGNADEKIYEGITDD